MEDEDGFIFLVDRKKDVIISGGENIYPVQIEDFLRTNEAILDVAVIGLADHRLGEISAAIIELKPGVECTEEDIQEFCKKLPRYKRPRKIIFADVPRNPTGKIEKPKLREKIRSNTSGCGTEPGIIKYVKIVISFAGKICREMAFFYGRVYNSGEINNKSRLELNIE